MAIAAAVYGICRFFTPDYLDDFEDDYDDEFDDDFFEDEEEDEAEDKAEEEPKTKEEKIILRFLWGLLLCSPHF